LADKHCRHQGLHRTARYSKSEIAKAQLEGATTKDILDSRHFAVTDLMSIVRRLKAGANPVLPVAPNDNQLIAARLTRRRSSRVILLGFFV
jgi:hypothetical protein